MYVLIAIAGFAAAVPAAVADSDSSKAFDVVTACRAITEPSERLACFDRTIAAFADARSKGDVVVVDRARVVERKRARFGLAMETDDLFGGGAEDRATAVRQLDTTIRSVSPGRGDLWTMELANGSVWRAVEALRFPPKPGQTIRLVTAPLGGFRASVGGRSSVLVKRVR
ncbi:hypothetical protein [Sphingomonas sp.]|jgi:hypothetical protein|uniref:hypothetical protein n=1 Tax=Sphingomonas sp. TaxID=28214 RepID=UPI002ED7C6D5